MDVEVVDQVWWFTSRAAGIVSWVLLSGSVVLGLTQSSRASRTLPAGWTLDLHRFLSMLCCIFLTGHLVALVPDNFVHFGWAELFVPYASEWRPGAVAWGIVAFWLLVAVQLTSLLRPRLPNRLWRLVHFLSFPVWIGATVHVLTAGTDADVPAFRVVQVVVIGAVVVLAGVRIRSLRRRSSARTLAVEEPVHVDQVDAGKR